MSKHTPNELDAQAVHVKALSRELCTRSAEYVVRACSVFADIEEGISLIVRKDHYYQLEAQAKSQPDLLTACEELYELADDGSASFDDPEPGGTYEKAKAAIEKAGSKS